MTTRTITIKNYHSNIDIFFDDGENELPQLTLDGDDYLCGFTEEEIIEDAIEEYNDKLPEELRGSFDDLLRDQLPMYIDGWVIDGWVGKSGGISYEDYI